MLVSGVSVGQIGRGLVVLVGIGKGDSEESVCYVVDKVASLRIFAGTDGRFDRSALEVGAELLVVSQFTLYADTRRGRRPSFVAAANSEIAKGLFDLTVALFQKKGLRVETGRFQEHMEVVMHNDGPVTIWIDSADRCRSRRDV